MTKPLLHRRGSDRTDDLHYEIAGYSHLIVEPEYCGMSRPDYWTVRDTRFSAGLDKWQRWQVLVVSTLGDARSWIRAGGPALWDPERKKTDKDWRPIPDGWQAGEEGSQVPCGVDPGVRGAGRLEHGPGRRRQVRAGSGGPDRRRDRDDRGAAHPGFQEGDVVGKRYAVCPGYVTSAVTGERHFIDAGALAWLYGVKPSECLIVPPEMQGDRLPRCVEDLVWLQPEASLADYEAMRKELARGGDAFKLADPDA